MITNPWVRGKVAGLPLRLSGAILCWLCEIIDNIDQGFGRETDGVEGISGADDDAWSLGMGAVDDVVIFDGTGMQPKAAKGIHGGVADDEPGFRRQVETFSQPFDIAFGVSVQVVRQLHASGDKLNSQVRIAGDIDKIISADCCPWRSGMAGKKAFRADNVGKQVIKNLHLLDISLAALPEKCLPPENSLKNPVFIDFRIKAVVVAADIEKIAGID